MLTEQEIFDKIATHLFKQNEAARRNMACLYRLEKNGKVLSCAAGCLIPDQLYDVSLEFTDVSEFKKIFFGENTYVKNDNQYKRESAIKKLINSIPEFIVHSKLIQELQSVHDNTNNWLSTEKMKSSLNEIAIDFNLNTDVFTNIIL